MYRKVLTVLVVLLLSINVLFAQATDDDWFWDQPISKIEFEGLKNVKKSDLTGLTSNYIDEPFTEDNYSELIDRLYALDLFENIDSYVKHDDKNPDNVYLVFSIEERPVIKNITFNGNKKIRNGELKEQIKIKTSDVFVEGKVLIDERTLRNYYLQKGYTASKVSHKIEKVDGGVNVIFNISEGASTIVKEINFNGNSIVSDRTLRGKLESKAAGFMKDGAYQASSIEVDKMAICNYYLERGYADVNILDTKIETTLNEEKQRNEIVITYIIQEGAQYTYDGLVLEGCTVFSAGELMALTKLKAGAVFNYTKFQEDLSNIATKYYENGYMSNDFQPIPTKDSDHHVIGYKLVIQENARSHVENIIIKGNGKTKDYVIAREIPIQPGDIFSREKILTGYRNLMNLQYFSNVIPEPQAGSEQNLIDLVFTVEEQSTIALNFGATFSAMTDPETIPISLYCKFENSNLAGEGKSASSQINISNTEQSIDFSYAQNWIGKLPVAFSENLTLSHSKTTSAVNMWTPDLGLIQEYYFLKYAGWTATLNTGFSRRWTPDFAIISAGAGLTNSIKDYVYDEASYVPVDQGLSAYANRPGVMNGVYTSLSIDDRDLSYDPSKGWFASERLSWYGIIPQIEKEFFLRSDTKLEAYLKICDIPVTEKWNLKLVLGDCAGVSAIFPAFDSTVTDSNRLYIDGVLNGRGWSDLAKTSKGMAMFNNKLELRMPIVPNIIGVDLFHDAVVVAPTVKGISALTINDWYFSFGPGIKILMPQFPLHFMFAFRYQITENGFKFNEDPFQFVLSFNLVNR